jgi:hypothetical protein
LQALGLDYREKGADCFMTDFEQLNLFGIEEPDMLLWNRSQDSYPQIPVRIFLQFLQSSPKSGLFHGDTAFLIPNSSESPKCAVDCSLSSILVENVPEKYYLSPKACQGILNRAIARGKTLPPNLKTALENVAKQSDSGAKPVQAKE